MSRAISRLSAAFGFGMFFVAVWALQREIRGHTLEELVAALRSIPPDRIMLAFLLTILCYASLTLYDLLALRCIHCKLPRLSVVLNSFICHAISINVGFSSLTGGSIRCHYYLRKGLRPSEIVRVLLLCSLTYWLGFFALGAGILMLLPPAPPPALHFLGRSLQPLGMVFLITIVAYLLVGFVRRKPLKIRQWVIPVAPTRVTLAQIAISVSEWILGTAILYVLLPAIPEFSYFHLLGYYFVAQVSGLLSQVPSGLGVFESVVLALVPPELAASSVLAALFLYRLIYSLFPLTFAGALLLIREFRYHRRAILAGA